MIIRNGTFVFSVHWYYIVKIYLVDKCCIYLIIQNDKWYIVQKFLYLHPKNKMGLLKKKNKLKI